MTTSSDNLTTEVPCSPSPAHYKILWTGTADDPPFKCSYQYSYRSHTSDSSSSRQSVTVCIYPVRVKDECYPVHVGSPDESSSARASEIVQDFTTAITPVGCNSTPAKSGDQVMRFYGEFDGTDGDSCPTGRAVFTVDIPDRKVSCMVQPNGA